MPSNLSRYKTDLAKLLTLGSEMHLDLAGRHLLEKGKLDPKDKEILAKLKGTFEREYQRWYTEGMR